MKVVLICWMCGSEVCFIGIAYWKRIILYVVYLMVDTRYAVLRFDQSEPLDFVKAEWMAQICEMWMILSVCAGLCGV